MFNLQLRPPVRLFGHTVCFLEDAAYLIRQHAILKDDDEERRLVRRLRDADDLASALLCERQVRAFADKLCEECGLPAGVEARMRRKVLCRQ